MRRNLLRGAAVAMAAIWLWVSAVGPAGATAGGPTTPIAHFVYLMQGDRSFDNYFGSYPGADGIPEGVCQQNVIGHPKSGCVKPFLLDSTLPASLTAGPHLVDRQWDNGAMDRFVAAFHSQGRDGTLAMGHYDAKTLPFYWSAASNYVLFDKFFSATNLGERTNRDFWVAGGASPASTGDALAQTTIFDRLQTAGVSWKFYVQDYQQPRAVSSPTATDPSSQGVRVPILKQARFVDDPEMRSHIVDLSEYYTDLTAGKLPSVAYIATSSTTERSSRSIKSGQNLVQNLVTQLMLSSSWSSSAFLLSYDGSGGWYDHVAPPKAAGGGYGLRVPALLISPYAWPGQVDHTVLDYTSALAFIEQNWEVAPLTSRDATATSLASAFDFHSSARPAVLLPIEPATSLSPPRASEAVYGTYGTATLAILLLVAAAVVVPWAKGRSPRPAPRSVVGRPVADELIGEPVT